MDAVILGPDLNLFYVLIVHRPSRPTSDCFECLVNGKFVNHLHVSAGGEELVVVANCESWCTEK